jgi:N utilization substance protein A
VAEGFETIEDLAMTPLDELASIEGFDENVAAELQRRAETALAQEATALEEQRVALGVSDEIAAIEALSAKDLIALGEKGVKSLDDLADLAGDELIEIVGAEALSEETANEIIMAARAHWFEGEDGDAA